MEIFIGLALGLTLGYFLGRGSGYDRGVFDERWFWADSLNVNTLDPEFNEIVDGIKDPVSREGQSEAKEGLREYVTRKAGGRTI